MADAIQRIVGGETEGILLQNYVLVSDWESAEGIRGVHLIYPDNQPDYINRALLHEGLTMLDLPDDPPDDEEDE